MPGESPSFGPDNVVFNLMKGLKKIAPDMSIDIITVRKDIDKSFIYTGLLPNVRVHYHSGFKFLPRCLQDPIIIRNFFQKNNFDIIHSHSPIALSQILNSKTPKILTLHGIYWKEKKFVKNPFLRLSFYNYNTYMFKKIFPKIDAFVAISPYVLDEITSMNICDQPPKMFQINNPIDDSFFTKTSYKENDNIIFYPAVIRALKNQVVSIDAINIIKNKIPDLKLTLAGSISEPKYFKKINSAVNRNNLSNIVKYVGKVSRDEMLNLYRKSSIVYLLSNHEVQPMVVLEAMATGTPVIASNLKCISYLVEDGVTGYLVNPNDYDKIAEYTLNLLSDKAHFLTMGKKAREYALKNFHSDLIAKQTINMYNEVLQSKTCGKSSF
ncbi:glycosyltransferase family 4 protein [Methanosarcina sp. WWM596]|uniref:glycosyltransferase family 4 protein n=1 Tax=Methanosarcina sp. WWM596 TaxID=1434103 RepID=UPI0018CCCCBF|nr:glycosyltransferase family 4 protein [Methanosarcina sp. WWM596]